MVAHGSSDENAYRGKIAGEFSGSFEVSLEKPYRFVVRHSGTYTVSRLLITENELKPYRNGSEDVELPRHYLDKFVRREAGKHNFPVKSRKTDPMDIGSDIAA